MRHNIGLVAIALVSATSQARAQGFQLQQHETVAAGERGFVVAAPWYAPDRTFAAALTLNYGHDVLQGGRFTSSGFSGRTIVEHQLTGHLDLAYSPWHRLQLSASLPVTLWEDGEARQSVGPASGPVVSDPRLGVSFRLFGDAARDAVSAHLAGALWIPVAAEDEHAGDSAPRGRLAAVFAGHVLPKLAWASNAGVLIRKQAGLNALSSGPGTVNDELQLGAALGYSSGDRKAFVGPEAAFGTVLADDRAFTEEGSHLELFLSGTYWAAESVQLGASLGAGVVRSPGTPDARGLLRLVYSPAPSNEKPAATEPAPEPVRVAATPEPTPAPEPIVEPEPAPAPAPAPVQIAAAPAEPEPPPAAEPAVDRAPLDELPRLRLRFARNQATTADSAALDRAAEILREHPEVTTIRVSGHSDETGPAEFNQRLSRARAQHVADQLVQRGVPAEKLEVRGFGSSRPLSNEATDASRARNRRVELTTTSK